MTEKINDWSMDLIYDFMSLQGIDVFEMIMNEENLTEEEKKNFWIAYDHYNKIQYWKKYE